MTDRYVVREKRNGWQVYDSDIDKPTSNFVHKSLNDALNLAKLLNKQKNGYSTEKTKEQE